VAAAVYWGAGGYSCLDAAKARAWVIDWYEDWGFEADSSSPMMIGSVAAAAAAAVAAAAAAAVAAAVAAA
jgi:hypothetical protein